MQDLIGRTLGHYRIVDKTGAGGMGEIYHRGWVPGPTIFTISVVGLIRRRGALRW